MPPDPFIKDFDPEIGVASPLAPGLRRLVAPNASPMTFRGTNTYLLGETEIAVIDPGPDDPRHLDAILKSVGTVHKISHIFVTHSHVDHSPLARRLGQMADAPVLALGDSYVGRSARMAELARSSDLGGGEGVDTDFQPDQRLRDRETVSTPEWSLTALATPGHFSNHLCFEWVGTGGVFSGDHVMSWATTLVSPPDGDLTAFMASLQYMATRGEDQRYYPGHGAELDNPQNMVRYQISHRQMREAQILEALATQPATPAELARQIYTEIPPELLPAAARNVFSHLIDLLDRNTVIAVDPLSPNAEFRVLS